jgi:hypothetical protein
MILRMVVGCGIICDTLLTGLSIRGLGADESVLASVTLTAVSTTVPLLFGLAALLLESFDAQVASIQDVNGQTTERIA